ncbi:MAG: NINE protein [Alistipes sp.]|jgi:TM2 domain-containing membrane protein YozV|nr:NINE protein [Alistipes sp.]MBQ2418508.1 NINE protein [Alistipes sp.]
MKIMKFCPNCGAQVDEKAVVCVKCGVALPTQTPVPVSNVDSRWLITLLLCFFLGGLGVHRFYVGKIGSGVVQLLTCGGCGIWALIDFIMILTGSFTDNNGNPIKGNL